jgi:hypothetical protein
MPQSLSSLLIHVIFSTKDREPLLIDTVRPHLHFLKHHGVDHDERYVWD